MGALIDLHQRAAKLAEENDHAQARVMFIEAIDGLEALMGLAHQSTLRALDSFIMFCVQKDFLDDAQQKMSECLTKHQEKWGNNDFRTLRIMYRLGALYRIRRRYGESEILLLRAKMGFESIYDADPERIVGNTRSIVCTLIGLFKLQEDFERAEQEFVSFITKIEALKGPYERWRNFFKHNLVHLYFDNPWEDAARQSLLVPPVPLLRMERNILELAEHAEKTSELTIIELCTFRILGSHYSREGQAEKIGPYFERIERLLEPRPGRRVAQDTTTQNELLRLKWCMFCINLSQGRCEAA